MPLNSINPNKFLNNFYSIIEEKKSLRKKNRKLINRIHNYSANEDEQILKNINHKIKEEDEKLTKKLVVLERLEKLEEQQLERLKYRNDLKSLEQRNRIISKISNIYKQSRDYMLSKSYDSNKSKKLMQYANKGDTGLSSAFTIGIQKPLYTKIREKRDYYFKMHSSSKIYKSKYLINAIKDRINLNQRRSLRKKNSSKSLSRIKVYSSLVNPRYPIPIYHPPNSYDYNQMKEDNISKGIGKKVSFDLTPDKNKNNVFKEALKEDTQNLHDINQNKLIKEKINNQNLKILNPPFKRIMDAFK